MRSAYAAGVFQAEVLIGVLMSYARPFRDRDDSDTRRADMRNRYLLDLGTDLGVDLTLHATALGMRDRLIARSIEPVVTVATLVANLG